MRNSQSYTPIAVRLAVSALFVVGMGEWASAQRVSKTGTTAADFLQIGVGAAPMALGGAYVARAADATALYWNPAGLGLMTSGEVLVSHSEWLASINFDYLGIVLPLGDAGTVGASITMLGVPEMMVRTEDRQEGTGELFDASDMAVGLSYGRRITDRFSVGATAKFIQQRIWHVSATGFAVDLGTRFQTDFFGGLVIGASLYNFGSDLSMGGRDLRTFTDPDPRRMGNNERIPANYEVDSWSLPLNFQIGVSMRPMDSQFHRLDVSIDALHPSSAYESVNMGVEYGYQQRVFLRAGYRSLFYDWSLGADSDLEGGLSGGVGVHQPLFYGGVARLDYAYRTAGRLGGVHIVGLAVTF